MASTPGSIARRVRLRSRRNDTRQTSCILMVRRESRAMLCELGMPSISSLFPVPRVEQVFAEDGTPFDASAERRFARFADELEWYASALREARLKGVPY
jgi:hypothetical protein